MDLFLSILKSVIYGVIEGITEWLPISSTGHMILAEQVLKFGYTEDFMEMFLVVIQLGAILAVVVLYFPKLWPFCSPKNGWIKKDTWILWFKVIVAALPAAIIGLPFDDLLDKLFYNYQTVSVTLILYGVLFIVVENYNKHRRPRIKSLERLPWSTALLIGVFQILADIAGSIGVDIRSRCAVHRYLRPAAPRPLEAVDHRIASLEAEFDVRFPGIAGAVVVVITARDRLVLPDGKLFQIRVFVVPDDLIYNGRAV